MASVTDIIASLKKKKDELDRGVNQGLENLRAWANPQVRQTFNREVIQPRIQTFQQSPIGKFTSSAYEATGLPKSLANIGALGSTGLGSLQMALNKPSLAEQSFNRALALRKYAGTEGSFATQWGGPAYKSGLATLGKGGVESAKVYLTAKGLPYIKPSGIAIAGGLGAISAKIGKGDVARGAGGAIGSLPSILGFSALTGPLIQKVLPKSQSNLIGKRIAPGIANVAQGIGLNLATGQRLTPGGMVFDLVTGSLGGPGQFEMTVPKKSIISPNVWVSDKNIINEALQKFRTGIDIQDFRKLEKDVAKMSKQYGLASYPNWNKLGLEDQVKVLDQRLNEMASGIFGVKMGIMGGESATGYKQATGKFSSLTDKKPRFEIDDSKSFIKRFPKEEDFTGILKEKRLGDYFEHKELFKNYPQIKDIPIVKMTNENGSTIASWDGQRIELGTLEDFIKRKSYHPYDFLTWDKDLKRYRIKTKNIDYGELSSIKQEYHKTLIHELQHVVQQIEGFATGGNPEQARSALKSAIERTTNIKEKERLSKMLNLSDYQLYKRLFGEIEARDASSRLYLSKKQRSTKLPYSSQDIKTNEIISNYRGRGYIDIPKTAKGYLTQTNGLDDFKMTIESDEDMMNRVYAAAKKAGIDINDDSFYDFQQNYLEKVYQQLSHEYTIPKEFEPYLKKYGNDKYFRLKDALVRDLGNGDWDKGNKKLDSILEKYDLYDVKTLQDIWKAKQKPLSEMVSESRLSQQVEPPVKGAEQPEITPEEVNKTRKILTGGGIPTGPKIKVKKLVLRIKSNKNYPKELRSMLEGTYQVSNEDQTIRDAKKLVRLDPVSAEARALNPQNSTDIAIGSELFNHYMDDGNIVKANQILNSTSGTNQGKMVHILARYERTTPQGAVRFATNAIKNFNKSHPNNPLKLTDDNIKGIYAAAKKIRSMPEGRERNIAANELMNQINNLIPSSIADKAITVWKAGLLTSLRTHGRNIIGNTMMGTTEILKDIPASLVDTALSQKTGKRTLTFTTKGLGEFGSQKTRQQIADMVTMGYDPSEQINKYDVRHITWGNNIVERALKKYTDVIFKTLAAEDISFWNASYARSLYDQAGAKAINAGKGGNKQYIQNLVDNATEDMKLIATKDANFATFHDKNQLTELANKVKKVLSKNEWTKIAGEVAAPFTGVPSSIVFKTIDYSPIGLIRGIFKAGKVIKPPDLEQIPNLQRQASQEIGRGIIGTGLLGLGAYLASRGLITGQPKNPKEAYQWQLEGKQANSVFLDGKWRSINSVGPQTLVILAGAKYNEEMNKGDRSLTNFALGLAKDQLNQTFLAGIQQPLQAIVDPARYGQPYASSQVSSLVPNIVKDISKSLDKSMRETNNPKEAFQASIPIWRNQLIEKRDVLGNVVPQEPTGFSALIDLFNSKTPISNIVVDELSRLYSVGNPATPSKLSKTQTINGKKVTLTPSQLNTLEAAIAPKLNEALSALIQSNNYLNLDDETKAKAISDTVEKVRKQVKGTIDLDTLSNKKQAELVDNLPQSNTSKIYKIIDKDTGNITTIDLSKPLEPPQLTGFDDIDKLLISSFNNAISTRVSNIVKLFKDGQITAEEANELIDALNKIKQSTKKTKKTTIKIKATPKIKITKAESIPIKIQIPTFRNLNFQTSRQPLRIKPMEIPKIKISKQTSNLI